LLVLQCGQCFFLTFGVALMAKMTAKHTWNLFPRDAIEALWTLIATW